MLIITFPSKIDTISRQTCSTSIEYQYFNVLLVWNWIQKTTKVLHCISLLIFKCWVEVRYFMYVVEIVYNFQSFYWYFILFNMQLLAFLVGSFVMFFLQFELFLYFKCFHRISIIFPRIMRIFIDFMWNWSKNIHETHFLRAIITHLKLVMQ